MGITWDKSMSMLSLFYGRLKGIFGIICDYFPKPSLDMWNTYLEQLEDSFTHRISPLVSSSSQTSKFKAKSLQSGKSKIGIYSLITSSLNSTDGELETLKSLGEWQRVIINLIRWWRELLFVFQMRFSYWGNLMQLLAHDRELCPLNIFACFYK